MNYLFFAFYELILWAAACIAIPKAFYQMVRYKKYRHSLMQRLGLKSQSIQTNQSPSIWIHAVSVGETKAVVSLARVLKQRFPSHALIISSITETGHAEAKRSLSFADHHIFLPYDFRFLVNRMLKQARPELVILCESDFWLNFLHCAKKQGASLALVNGKISEKSTYRFQTCSFFAKRLFGLFDLLCVQNPLYQTRFQQVGAPIQQLAVTGNLKLDEEYPHLNEEEVTEWRKKLGISENKIVLTIGSTHYPEEEILIEQLKNCWKKYPHLLVIIVPRHPERFKEVSQMLNNKLIPFVSYTDLNHYPDHNHKVILMDAMGLLRLCYQLADLAFVGGSLTDKVGGHNILEPCWYGKPVLYGPHMHTQFELVELMQRYQAGLQITIDQFQNTLCEWIENVEKRKEIGFRGLELVHDLRGSTKRTLNRMNFLLQTFEPSQLSVSK